MAVFNESIVKALDIILKSKDEEGSINEAIINEVFIDELMLALGYNKKFDVCVKRCFESTFDWEISYDGDRRIAFKTNSLDSENVEIEGSDSDKVATERGFQLLMTNIGTSIELKRVGANALCDTIIIPICEDISDEHRSILASISKDTFDISVVDKFINDRVADTIIKTCIESKAFKVTDERAYGFKDRISGLLDYIVGGKGIPLGLIGSVEHVDAERMHELEGKVEQMEAAKAELNERIADLTSSVSDRDKAIAEKCDEVLAKADSLRQVESERDALKQELTDTQSNLDTAKKDLEDTQNSLIEMEKKLENSQSEAAKLKSEVDSLNEMLNEAKNQSSSDSDETIRDYEDEVRRLKEDIEFVKKQAKSSTDTVASLSNRLLEKDSKISEIEELLKLKEEEAVGLLKAKEDALAESQELRDKVEELTSEAESRKDAGADSDTIAKFKNNIQKLTEQVYSLQDENKELKKNLDKLKDELDKQEGSERRQAMELLDMIQADDDAPTSYVGVVNTELYQQEELSKFIGDTLQRLYEIKNFEASQYIFNGDLFKLVTPSTRNDLLMNKKNYDVDITGVSEADALNKLRIVYSHFSDIVFLCKRVGRHTERFEDSEQRGVQTSVEVEASEDTGDAAGFDSISDVEQECSGNGVSFDNGGFDSMADEFSSFMSAEEEEDVVDLGETTEISRSQLITCTLAGAAEMNERFPDIRLLNVRYVGSEGQYIILDYAVDPDHIVANCIQAIIALEAYKGTKDVLKELKKLGLSSMDECFMRNNGEHGDEVRVIGTNYVICGIRTMWEGLEILNKLTSALDIDTNLVEIYMGIPEDDITDELVEQYGAMEDEIESVNETNIPLDGTEKLSLTFKGSMMNSVLLTGESTKIRKNLFMGSTVIKTKYLSTRLNDSDDIIKTVKAMLDKAVEDGALSDFSYIGRTGEKRFALVSDSVENVKPSHTECEVFGKKLYISNLDPWETTEVLINLHIELFRDSAVAIKADVCKEVLDYLVDAFKSSSAMLNIGVYTLRNYIVNELSESK